MGSTMKYQCTIVLLLMLLLYVQVSQARVYVPDAIKAGLAKRFYSWEESKRVDLDDKDEARKRRMYFVIGKRFGSPGGGGGASWADDLWPMWLPPQ